jgi:hypothetical protein
MIASHLAGWAKISSALKVASWNASEVYGTKEKPVIPSSTVSARPPTWRTMGGEPYS